jgi:hypothetical protein
MAALRTWHGVTRFQIAPCREGPRLGIGRRSETGCFSASEQLFFDFRVNRRASRAARGRAASD